MKAKTTKQTELNYKVQIAEILFNSNASNEIVMWALSHLPDAKSKGNSKAVVFKHEAEKTVRSHRND